MDKASEGYRSSVYLVRRAEALLAVLRFFSASAANALERRLQFLAQSDFWDWEMENLIYSFTNFAERSRSWQSSQQALDTLGQLGIVIDAKLVRRVRWRGGWQIKEQNQRVAPLELLAETVDAWNRLIDLVELHLVQPMQDKAERFGIQTLRNLNHLRKSMPALDLPAGS